MKHGSQAAPLKQGVVLAIGALGLLYSIARADETPQLRWYASLDDDDKSYLAVDVDLRALPSNLVVRDIRASVIFFDAQNEKIGARSFAITDAHTPALNAGEFRRKYFVHPFSAAKSAVGSGLTSSLMAGGANFAVMGVPPENTVISNSAATVLGRPPGDSAATNDAPGAVDVRRLSLPGGGVKNRGAAIGPFCCTGETAIISFADGQPAGFVYFFDWSGKAKQLKSNRSVAPTLKVLVSGATDLTDARSPQVQAEVEFPAQSLRNPGATRRARAGGLEFVVTALGAQTTTIDGQTYFFMDTPRVEVSVSPTP